MPGRSAPSRFPGRARLVASSPSGTAAKADMIGNRSPAMFERICDARSVHPRTLMPSRISRRAGASNRVSLSSTSLACSPTHSASSADTSGASG